MWTCSKCLSESRDIFNLCERCGAVRSDYDTVANKPRLEEATPELTGLSKSTAHKFQLNAIMLLVGCVLAPFVLGVLYICSPANRESLYIPLLCTTAVFGFISIVAGLAMGIDEVLLSTIHGLMKRMKGEGNKNPFVQPK